MLLNWLILAVYGFLLGAIVASDYKYFKIPNKLVFPGMALAIFFNILQGTWVSSLLGGFAVLALLIIDVKLAKAKVGMGDLKLSMLIGFMLGWPFGLFAVAAGIVGGGLVSAVLLKMQVVRKSTILPMAVFLGVSAGVFLLAGMISG